MTYTLQLSGDVEADLVEVYEWYEDKKKDLGLSFIIALEISFNRIQQRPKSYRKHYKDLCDEKMNRFPYLVIFKTEGLVITVVKIVHERRHPRIWRKLK